VRARFLFILLPRSIPIFVIFVRRCLYEKNITSRSPFDVYYSFRVLRIAAIKSECFRDYGWCFSDAIPVVRKIIVRVSKTRGARIGFARDLQPTIRLPRTFVFLSFLFRDFIPRQHTSSPPRSCGIDSRDYGSPIGGN
jgi:hypothetical protein